MTTVAVLGSTGSIGTQTLDVVRAEPDRYDIVSLAGSTSVETLAEQAHEFRPKTIVVTSDDARSALSPLLPGSCQVTVGAEALAEAAVDAEVAVNGVVGFAGLPVTIAVLEAGHRLALANKESLIAAGPVVRRVRTTAGAELLPVDSEHCAIHQCLRSGPPDSIEAVDRLVLTASGGPFRGRSAEQLASVSVDDALEHPTWSMGPKITVDSSTLMNKGLEVIEAHELFGIDFDDIDVVVHPQSVVHSMVEFVDGATVAQLSMPDMRLCIGYALAYPERSASAYGRIDWASMTRLDFELPDLEAFPCLALAYVAGRTGGMAPAALNAANEVAVAAFLDHRIAWNVIPDVLEQVLTGHDWGDGSTVETVIAVDDSARRRAAEVVDQRSRAA